MTSEKSKRILLVIGAILLILFSFAADEAFNALASRLKSTYLLLAFALITNIGIVLMVMFVIPSIMTFRKNNKPIFLLAIALLLSTLASLLIKIIFLRERPNLDINYETFYMLNYSFPSMHSMIAFSFLPVLVMHFKRQKTFWISCAFLVAASRVFLGFHFLSDVVFGAVFGFILGKTILHMGEKNRAKL